MALAYLQFFEQQVWNRISLLQVGSVHMAQKLKELG